MLTGSPFIDKNHLRFSLLLMFVNEVCAFAFFGYFFFIFQRGDSLSRANPLRKAEKKF